MTINETNYKIKKKHYKEIKLKKINYFIENILKIKKVNIALFLFLNYQFLINAYALNYRKIDLVDSNSNNLEKRNKIFNNLFAEKINDEDSISTKEIEEIEKFIEETFDSNDSEIFANQIQQLQEIENNIDLLENEPTKKDNKIKKKLKKEDYIDANSEKGKERLNTNFKQNINNDLPLPSRSIISSSQFKVPSRGYVNLKGPKITLNLKSADPIETLKLIGKLGNYGIVIIGGNNSENQEISGNSKISAIFNEVDISDAFNSVLLSANLQAILEKNIIFVGKDILSKSLKPKVSKTYRMNQVNAASVADYLSTLGAQISKVML